jgi:isoleucyl-tRNA synthetase
MAEPLIEQVLGGDDDAPRHRVLASLTADDLLGLRYEAPFRIVEVDVEDRYLVASDHVTTSDGTGLVHIAPAFGGDDLEIGRREGLPVVNPVNAEARFSTGPWEGQFVKDADPEIIEALREAATSSTRAPTPTPTPSAGAASGR